MQPISITASTNPQGVINTTPTVTGATDSTGSSKTPSDADVSTTTSLSQNAPASNVASSSQSSPNPGQDSNGNNASTVTSAGTGGAVPDVQGAPVSSPATTPASSTATTSASPVGQPSITTPSASTPQPTVGATTQAPNTAGITTPTFSAWSILTGLLPQPTTTAPISNNQIQMPASLLPIGVALPVTTGGNQLQQSPQPTRSARKRKQGNRKPAPALNIMRRKRIRPTIIDDRVALSVLKELGMTRSFLGQGKILAWALQPHEDEFSNIYDYVGRSQEHGFGVKILSILRIIPRAHTLEEDGGPPVSFSQDPNADGKLRMMLWHGTRQKVVASILESGLRIPPWGGGLFGKGIYFADRIAKSARYCDGGYSGQGTAYLFLCDVLLGEVYKSGITVPSLQKAPPHHVPGRGMVDCDSVQGCGQRVPDPEWNVNIDGCIWPVGPTKSSGNYGLCHNEFIVYDTKQVQPKYLVKVQFVQTPILECVY